MTALTLTELKNHLRYEDADTSQDSALGTILAAAQRWVENYTGHILVQRIVTENLAAFPDYHQLRYKPYVAESAEVSYFDGDYAEQTFTGIAVLPALGGHRLIPTATWPATVGGITLSYMAGYEDAYDAPEDLMHAMAIYAAMADEERADMTSAGWKALDQILLTYRMPTLA